ncbi:MAG: hypothetical protein FWD58_01340 [Firmicutes bacterium]|nr:hypothetical protein [Bacillota bacterium]
MNEPSYTLIEKIVLDERGILYIMPQKGSLEKIYRSATGVRWDSATASLCSERPIDNVWGVLQWYAQMLAAVRDEYGLLLKAYKDTIFENIGDGVQAAILEVKLPGQTNNAATDCTEPILIKKTKKRSMFFSQTASKKEETARLSSKSASEIFLTSPITRNIHLKIFLAKQLF